MLQLRILICLSKPVSAKDRESNRFGAECPLLTNMDLLRAPLPKSQAQVGRKDACFEFGATREAYD